MVVFILNESLEKQETQLDLFSSFIWNPRYRSPGSFQINCDPIYFDVLNNADDADVFIVMTDDLDHVGVIESVVATKDDDGIDELVVKGRMAESLLSRRIAIGNQYYNNVRADLIFNDLITKNIISPSDTKRIIPQISLGTSVGVTETSISQIKDENLLTAIQRLSKINDIGFKVRYEEVAGVGHLKFYSYKGKDRTLWQTSNPAFVLSRGQDTATESKYSKETSQVKTYVYIQGDTLATSVESSNLIGLKRREDYIDLTGTILRSTTDSSGTPLTLNDTQYTQALKTEAKSYLTDKSEDLLTEFNPSSNKVYGVDFRLGDRVTCIEDSFDLAVDKTIEGVEQVWDNKGYSISLELE